MDNQNKKEKNLIIIIGILAAALIVSVAYNIVGNNSQAPERNLNQGQFEAKEIISQRNYININFSENGFVPKVVRTKENNLNFINRTENALKINLLNEDGSEYGVSDVLVSRAQHLFGNLPLGSYTAIEEGSGLTLDIEIIE